MRTRSAASASACARNSARPSVAPSASASRASATSGPLALPGQRRNLEIKAVDPDPAATLRAALAFGAEDQGVLRQRDTYFHAVQGQLKLREAPPNLPELIAYARAELAGPKVSHYRIVSVADHAGLIDVLRSSLGVRAVVDKARRLLLWRNVRIHLDRVAGLGDYVELEAVATSPGGLEVERDRVEELRHVLGIGDERLVAHGYAHLLTRAGSILTRP